MNQEPEERNSDPGIFVLFLLWEAVLKANRLSPMRLAALCRIDGESSRIRAQIESTRILDHETNVAMSE
jgi:hypothetical protein